MADPIKEAFTKAKQDIFNLQSQIESLKREILALKELIKASSLNLQQLPQIHSKTNESATPNQSSTQQEMLSNTAQNLTIRHIPTDEIPQYSPKAQYMHISIGNDGVPTDRQTNQQTDTSAPIKQPPALQKLDKKTNISHLEELSNIINSLDSIKKELRRQFKHLTSQEMTVFSCIYDLENKGFIVDYPLLSQKMSLSESSIRDYVQKIIRKGIPIIKTKENNKKILLKIDENLKKIASLQTIQSLRQI